MLTLILFAAIKVVAEILIGIVVSFVALTVIS